MGMMPRIRAVAFDAFGTLFDVYSVGALAEQLFPGNGAALAEVWRRKQIEYALLRSLGERYLPFWEVTCNALDFAAAQLALPMMETARTRLINEYACLSPFPENLGALQVLKAEGVPLAILSNGTPQMLEVCVSSAGMDGIFDFLLSADSVRRYKPHADVYALGPQAFGCDAGEILFVSSNGWDIAGAGWFGYTTFWLNRGGQPAEALGVQAAFTGTQLSAAAEVMSAQRAGR